MRFCRIFLPLALFLSAGVSGFSQNIPPEWLPYTREGYYFSVKHETHKKKVSESEFVEYLLGLARSDVAKQIKINVSDAASIEKNAANGVTSVSYKASSNFSTDVTLRYVETRTYYDKKKREGYAIAWLSKEDLQNIYTERANKVISMLDVAKKAEDELKIDVALKYNYWALILSYTLPEDLPVIYPGPNSPAREELMPLPARVRAKERIDALLDGLVFKFIGRSEEDPLLGCLEVTYGGKSVSSLDYIYNDGQGFSAPMQVRDGVGLVEFRASFDIRNIDIKVEVAYEDESASDPEMKMALAEVEAISFQDAWKRGVSVYQKKPRPGKRKKHQQLSPSEQLASEVSAGFEQIAHASASASAAPVSTQAASAPSVPEARKGSAEPASTQADPATPAAAGRKESATARKGDAHTPAQPKDSSALCLDVVTQTLDAIGRQSYSEVKELFTEEGYDTFDKLLHYGNAKILDRSHIQAVPYAYGYVCRSVPMKFSFKSNRKSFVENVVFWFDKHGKIDNLTFALDAESVKGILSKTQWTDGAKMAIISFLENYKTAFALTRIDYIDAIFSDDALIIVGKVVKKARIEGGIRLEQEDVEYNRYTKTAYISQLRRSFASKEYINLKFANTEISKLTRGGHENFYGIQLKQDYFSSNYGDTGYLYLLVDMEDSRKPLIYVRTWQPQPDPDFGLYGPGNI